MVAGTAAHRRRTTVATRDNGLKNTGAEVASTLKQSVSAPIGNRQIQAQGYAEDQSGEVRKNAVQAAQHTESVRDTARRTDPGGTPSSGAPLAGAGGYDAFEADFRGHHHTNAARRRGPYEHYRLVYRYGYDLGTDPRYCSADWPNVERDARPRWEERNPSTWEEFKETIHYAWDKARGQR
jgi:hypothetical protein